MATATVKSRCVTCKKENAITKCEGCSESFCYNDFGKHRQELNKQLDEVETNRDLIRQSLSEHTSQPQKHPLIHRIDQWEHDSINKIKQTTEENRQLLLSFTSKHNIQLEDKLNKLTDQLKQSREENSFFETDLNHWKEQLKKLEEEMAKPSNIRIQEDSTTFINKISVDTLLCIPKIDTNAKWVQNGISVVGGNGSGTGLNQLSNPHGVYVDDDQTVYVVDYSNDRIVAWKSGATSGQVVAGGNGAGNGNDQLYGPGNVIVDQETDSLIISDYRNKRVVRWPRQNGTTGETIISNVDWWGLAMGKDGHLYVLDMTKHEARRYQIGEVNGTLVAGRNGQGNRLDQLNGPFYICVDADLSVYISDCANHRVMKWIKDAKEGIVVAGGQGPGNSLTQLSGPYGVAVDQSGSVYVVDSGNCRVMRWLKGATQGSVVVGGNGSGGQANQLSHSSALSFDRQNNLYVVDHSNHRVQKFNIESNPQP